MMHETIERRGLGPGLGAILALVALNLLLGGLTAREARAGGGGTCDSPGGDETCYCFGNVCVDDFPGFDKCSQGWHWVVIGGDTLHLLDPIYEEEEYTGATCEEPN